MSNKVLNIIIVTYNSENEINRCIDSLLKEVFGKYKINIFVIDNASTDDTIQKIEAYRSKIIIEKNKSNIGFSKAINQIIKNNKADYYLLLNPDAYIKKGSISKLIKCSIENKEAICGGKTIYEDGGVQGDHFRIPNLMVGLFDFTNLRKIYFKDKYHNYFYYLDQKTTNKCQKVGCVTGGFMLISAHALDKIGLFDERYFMYLEDVDYCLRASRVGVKVMYCPQAVVVHVGGASSKNTEKSNLKSWFNSRSRYFIKNHSVLENMLIQPIFTMDKIMIYIKKAIYENIHH